jgi:AmmeMemoRadiSam system protein A
MNLTPGQQRFLLDLARAAIVNNLRGMYSTAPAVEDPLLQSPFGCFVTMHDAATHRLRGCIGRIQSPDPLVVGVHESAIGALRDPRFTNYPITLGELPRLDLEVSVLSPLTEAAHALEFEPLEHGIFLSCQGRTGTFLPQVARETGWSREQLLARLCGEKMGLAADAWQGVGTKLFTYTATVIGPVPFVDAPIPMGVPGGLAGNRFTM